VGVNLLMFDIREIEEGDFFVKFKVRNEQDGFQWVLVSGGSTTAVQRGISNRACPVMY
jgi:hypothetical protein